MIRYRPGTIRLAVLFERIGPYHHARLDAAGRRGDVVAIEFSAIDRVYAWNRVAGRGSYERRTVLAGQDVASTPTPALRHRLNQVLRHCCPQVVAIPGWGSGGALCGLDWCRVSGTPAVVMSDSWDTGRGRRWYREAVKRRIIPLFSSALVAGAPQRRYLEQLGMAPPRIFTGYDVVDNDHFASGAQRARRSASTLRQQYGLPRHFFLCMSRLIREKNLHRLLLAYAAYRAAAGYNAWHLVLAGDGPLEPDLRRLQRELGLQGAVHFTGFQQYDRLPAYYGLAEVLILPSVSETWGLVVNEAMAAALPVLVSDRCGCVRDLVSHGHNGLCFDPCNVRAIRDAMLRMASGDGDRRAMGRLGQQRIRSWSTENFANNLWRAAELAVDRPARRPGPWSGLALTAAARRRYGP